MAAKKKKTVTASEGEHAQTMRDGGDRKGGDVTDKSTKRRCGRPTVVTREVVGKLEAAFSVGANDTEACAHAGISRDTYYSHRKTDSTFSDRIDALKEKLPLKAKSQLAALVTAGDPMTVKWYLERVRRKEFGTRHEIDHTTKGDKIEPTRIIFEDAKPNA